MSFKNAQTTKPPSFLHKQGLDYLCAGQMDKAAQALSQALSDEPRNGLLHCDLAYALAAVGQGASAEKHFEKALKLLPEHPRVLIAYGVFLAKKENPAKAQRLLEKALKMVPGHAEALHGLAMCFHMRGELDQAEELYIAAIRALPGWPEPHYNIGRLYQKKGVLERAQAAFEKTIELYPAHARARCALADLLNGNGHPEEAISHLEKAVQADPSLEAGWVKLAGLHNNDQQVEKLRSILKTAKLHVKNSPALLLEEASLLRRENHLDEARGILEKLVKLPEPPVRSFYELGMLYDRQKETGKAFSCFEKSNNQQKEKISENEALWWDNFPSMIRGLHRKVLETGKDWPEPPPLDKGVVPPVFLVGFPRSGTTLLEQIFASHPNIDVAGELEAAGLATSAIVAERKKDIEDCLQDLNGTEIEKAREAYIADLDKAGFALQEGRLFIDKMPFNLVYAPVMRQIFPQAKFILALRHPCDCVLSCYMQYFNTNQAMMHMTDLKKAAQLYDLAFGAWEDFVKILNLNVHTIRYEDVVQDMKGEITKVLEFIGLEWRDDMEAFDKTAQKRVIRTPSATQVTQKIYTDAVYRWQRYERQLRDSGALEILLPWADKYGYERPA